MDFVQINTVSTVDAVCQALENDIFHLRYPPGSKITEADLTSRYGVSRNTIREAIAHLLSNGLLEKIANKGVYVRRITSSDLLELFRLRELLEREAMVQIIQAGVIPSDLIRHAEALKQIDSSSYWDENVMDAYVRADIRFHQSMVAAAGSPRLIRLYDSIIAEVMFCLYLAHSRVPATKEHRAQLKRNSERTDEHRRLLEALENEDLEMATQVLSKHISAACDRYYQQLKEMESK